MAHLLGPRSRRSPGFGVCLDRISTAVEKELHQFQTTPSAGPPKRRALQDVIAQIQPGAGVENQRGKGHSIVRGQMFTTGPVPLSFATQTLQY
jgi:hypothetical protein